MFADAEYASIQPDGEFVYAFRGILQADGGLLQADRGLLHADGGLLQPHGRLLQPDGELLQANGKKIRPFHGSVHPTARAKKRESSGLSGPMGMATMHR